MVRDITKLKQKVGQMQKDESWSMQYTIEQFLQLNHINFICNYTIAAYTFDYYCPDFNLTIDLLYVNIQNEQRLSLNMPTRKVKSMLHDKALFTRSSNIKHVYIWDYQWYNERQRAVLQNIILNYCNKSKTVMARKTYIKVDSAINLKDFFNVNNIQGYRAAKDAISLYSKDTNELLMSYAIGHAYFGKGKYDIEIIRGASKLGYCIVGGASKLWKYLTTQYAPSKSIVYYVDLNYYNGKSLDVLCEQYTTMKLVTSKYSFKNWYVEEQVMRNRDPKHHYEVLKAIEDGLIKTCWDAGSLVYVYTPYQPLTLY